MLKNILKIFISNIVGKFFGLLKIVLLIKLFGTNALTDALIVVLSIYWFWTNIFVSSLFSISLIPSLAKVEGPKAQLEASLKVLHSLNFITIFGLGLVLFYSSGVIAAFAPVQNQDFIANAKLMLIVLAPLLLLIPTTEIFTITNQFNDRMYLASVNKIVWNILQFLAIALSFYFFKLDSTPLIWIFSIFTILSYAVTSYLQLRGAQFFNYFSILDLFKTCLNSALELVKENYLYFGSILLTQLNLYIDNYFISGLPLGFISKYNIIIKVPELAQSILITSITIVFFNKIATQQAKIKRLFLLFSAALIPIFAVGFIGVYFLGVPILKLIYSAQALSPLADDYVRKIIFVITANIFFSISISMLVKVYVTKKSPRYLLFASLINVGINIIANHLLIHRYGLLGISFATLVSSCVLYGLLLLPSSTQFFNKQLYFNKQFPFRLNKET